MKPHSSHELRTLAIAPLVQGFGFVVLEGKELIDYGLKITGVTGDQKNRQCLKQVERLMEHYQPDVLVLEDTTSNNSRRGIRVKRLLQSIANSASQKKVMCRRVSRLSVQKAFAQSNARTKYQIAVEIAKDFPELVPRLPRNRKPWMNQDARMSIFDAIALTLTYLIIRTKNAERKVDQQTSQ